MQTSESVTLVPKPTPQPNEIVIPPHSVLKADAKVGPGTIIAQGKKRYVIDENGAWRRVKE